MNQKSDSNLTEETIQNFTGTGVYRNLGLRNYIGDYVNGKEHGVGLYESRFRDFNMPTHRYAGQFNNNKVEGIGIKIWTYSIYNQIYCGEYKNNQRNGMGYCKLPTGASFIGEYKDNILDGFGTLITYEGLKFIGDVY